MIKKFFLPLTFSLLPLTLSAQTKSMHDDQVTLTDLYYGMAWDATTSAYAQCDSLLESFPSIAKQECSTVWYDDEADRRCKFNMSMGLYVDKTWPSEAVQRRIEEAVDTLLTRHFHYFNDTYYGHPVDKDAIAEARSNNRLKSTDDIMRFGKGVFDAFTAAFTQQAESSLYAEAYSSRVCIIAHKIFENAKYVTYIVEDSYSYNGSNGCCSSANYYTVSKSTGKMLTSDQVLKTMPKKKAYKQISSLVASNPDNYPMAFSTWKKDDFFQQISGAALVKEGIVLYYLPYTVGSGADGEPFFILNK